MTSNLPLCLWQVCCKYSNDPIRKMERCKICSIPFIERGRFCTIQMNRDIADIYTCERCYIRYIVPDPYMFFSDFMTIDDDDEFEYTVNGELFSF